MGILKNEKKKILGFIFYLNLCFRILIMLSNPSITIIMMIGTPQVFTVTAKVPYMTMATTMKRTIESATYAKMTLFSGKKWKYKNKDYKVRK